MPHTQLPELRTDVLTGQQVIIAPLRSERPFAVVQDVLLSPSEDPFAEGNEFETPPERFAVRDAASMRNGPGWKLRVVPNRFPAVVSSGGAGFHPAENHSNDRKLEPSATVLSQPECEPSLFPSAPAIGEHDVVIECPDSRSRLVDLSVAEIAAVLAAWRTRMHQIIVGGLYSSVAVFRNEGLNAGASLAHCHSQVIASKQLPPLDAERHSRVTRHRDQTGRDLIGDLIQAERRDGHRILCLAEHYTVLCPFASRTSWHVRFVPVDGMPQSFADASHASLAALAMLLKNTVASLETVIGKPFSFNLILPHPRIDQPPEFRWMLDLLPRTGRIAGWEFLSGVDIVTTSPERAAEVLRSLGKISRQR